MSVLALRPHAERSDAVALSRPIGRPAWLTRYVRSLVLLDFTLVSLAAALALVLDPAGMTPHRAAVAAAFPLLWVSNAGLTRAYEARFLGFGSEEYRRVFDGGVRLLALSVVVTYAFEVELARSFVLVAFPAALLLIFCGRFAVRKYVHRQRRQGRFVHRVVVTGTERAVAELVRQLRRDDFAGLSVVGACIDRSRGPEVEGVPVLGTAADIVRALEDTGADTVAVGAWSSLSQADLRRLSWQLEGTGVAFVVAPSIADIAGPRVHIRPIAGLPLLHIEEPEFDGSRRVFKGVVDRGAAAVALVLLAPLLLTIALCVRLDSPGPVFFHQERTGRRGSTFRIHKFRSMHVDAESQLIRLAVLNESDGPLFKIKDDPRVTRVGRVLRRYSLDELPQLWNVLCGHMSLVGPRPPLPREVALYHNDVQRRLLVKPGLTGLWQVSGRSDLSWEESVRLDLHYVENWSLPLDMTILWKTLAAVLRRQGAY